jgi:hypothetical protein
MKSCANLTCSNTWEVTSTTSPKKRFCSLACRRKSDWAAELASRAKVIRFCAICGDEFVPKVNQLVCRSPRCVHLNFHLGRLVVFYKRARRTNVQKYGVKRCMRCRCLFKSQTPNQTVCAPCSHLREVRALMTYQCQVKKQVEKGQKPLSPHSFVKCEVCAASVPYRNVRYCSPECRYSAELLAQNRTRAAAVQASNLFRVLAISSTLTNTNTNIKNEC